MGCRTGLPQARCTISEKEKDINKFKEKIAVMILKEIRVLHVVSYYLDADVLLGRVE